eukprot:TRINITY_DN5064_c1_g1_i1.p1 TRINITY_DN5064_c1_g1~~TRINITY_DN5064_c1_g1_i1.p1  ORF type:complete len:509 (-),score=152.02 TRINITY_DN5064_c1_g1_i1:337-1863(-)
MASEQNNSNQNVHQFKIYATGPGFQKEKYWMGRFNLANPEFADKEENGAKFNIVKEGNKRKIEDSQSSFVMQGQPDSMGSSALAGYFVLMRQGEGQFVTIPAQEWYSFKPFRQTVETLEEVEEAMINKRVGAVRRAVPVPLSQQKKDEEEDEDGEGGKNKKGRAKKVQIEDDGLMLKKGSGSSAKKKKKPSGDVDEVLDGGDEDLEKGADLDGALGEEADRAEDWDFVEDVANDDLGMAPDLDLEMKDEEDDLEDDDKKKMTKNEDLMDQVNIKDDNEEDMELTEEGKKLKEIIEKQDGANSGDETTKSKSLEEDKSRSKSTDSADEKEIDVQEFLGVKKSQEKQENLNTPPVTPPGQNSVKRKIDDVPDLLPVKKIKSEPKINNIKIEQKEIKTEVKTIKKEPTEQKQNIKQENNSVKKETNVKKEERSSQKQKQSNQGSNNKVENQGITEQEIIDYVKNNKVTASALSAHFKSRLQKAGAQGKEQFKTMVKNLVRQDKETKLLLLK